MTTDKTRIVTREVVRSTTVATNRRARHEYELFEPVEAGLALAGWEVKSLRAGRASLAEAFARVERGEAFLYNLHIPPYPQAAMPGRVMEPARTRKLLLHRREIARMAGQSQRKGFTLVPVELYFKRGIAKVSIAVAKAKKLWDKRDAVQKREVAREADRARKWRGVRL